MIAYSTIIMKKISLFPYPGGKFYILDEICKIYKQLGKDVAVDVFGGSGKFLLNVQAKNKVYNDLDSRLVNLFRVLKEQPNALFSKFDNFLYSREMFNQFKNEGKSADPVEDAFRFLYLLEASFDSNKESFDYSIVKSEAIRMDRSINKLKLLHNEIKSWTIEHLDFRNLIKRYDSENTFFYLDPPYHNCYWYSLNFKDQDFVDLAKILQNISGKYLLNINKDNFVIETFGPPSLEKQYANMCNLTKNGSRSRRVELFYWN